MANNKKPSKPSKASMLAILNKVKQNGVQRTPQNPIPAVHTMAKVLAGVELVFHVKEFENYCVLDLKRRMDVDSGEFSFTTDKQAIRKILDTCKNHFGPPQNAKLFANSTVANLNFGFAIWSQLIYSSNEGDEFDVEHPKGLSQRFSMTLFLNHSNAATLKLVLGDEYEFIFEDES